MLKGDLILAGQGYGKRAHRYAAGELTGRWTFCDLPVYSLLSPPRDMPICKNCERLYREYQHRVLGGIGVKIRRGQSTTVAQVGDNLKENSNATKTS